MSHRKTMNVALQAELAEKDGRPEPTAASRERVLEAMLESAIDYAIIAMDPDGLVTRWNEGARRLLGWTEAEMLGRSISVIFTPEDRQEGIAQAGRQAALRDGRGIDERWHQKKDGSRFWASGEIKSLRDPTGTIHGFVKILRDRTRQRLAAEAQRVDAEFLRSVLASSGDCIKVLDLDGKLTFMSEGGQRVMEVSDFNAIRGCAWPDFWLDDGNIAIRAALEAAKAGGIGHFQGFATTMAGTPKWWDVQVTPILGADGTAEKLLVISRDITAVREAEKALRESEEEYRHAVELSPQVPWTADPAGNILTTSNRWLVLTGYTLKQALGSGWMTMSHPDDRLRKNEAWRRSCTTGEPYDSEYRVRTANGEYRWMRARAFARRDASGAIIRWYGSTEDIHERWTAEEALRQSEARLDSALSIAALGMFEWDLKTDCVQMSDRIWEVFGLEREDPMTVERFFAAVLPEDLPGVRAAVAAAPSATGRIEIEYRIRRADNAVRDIVSLSKLVRNANGEATCRVGVVVDVTERKQNERMLKELNETLEQRIAERTAERNRMWQLSADIMLVARFDGAIIAVNPAWTAVLGWTEKELVGRNFLQLTHPDDLPEALAGMESRSGRSLLWRSESRYRHKDGSYRWIAWTAVPGQDLIHAVGRDCTADREKAEALNLAEEQLRQAQKMEAVGQLTGGLAHDFNNMLQGITGTLELLGTRIAQGRFKDLERYIDAAQEASKRAAALTHRLLAFSRRQTLDPKPTNIHRLVIGMEELIRRAMGPAIDIEMVGTAGLWTALVDPNQLENALLNLCINARHAMPDGGRLTIETANQWLEQRAAGELTPGQYLTLSVRDTGIGMTPEVVKRAFDPFFTTKPIGVGTGLGLSMIYGFARQSSGQVQIESQVGKGTTVRLYLPRHPGEEAAVEAHGEPADAPRAEQGETVLVVDDEPIVRMLATEVLEELGYRSIEAGDGAAALQILRSNLRIDLLVTDVGLPGGMNGRQVADAGRALRPGLKVLFITGYAENAGLSNGTLEPGMQVLTKPFAMDVLGSRIKALIARA